MCWFMPAKWKASRIDGNVGMLGADYAGYFEWNDVSALGGLLQRCRDDKKFLELLTKQCAAPAFLFAPDREKRTLLRIVEEVLQSQR